ncbi:hypothetical protein LAD12857_23520 [Lacrimispora amygdalina]|uniref:Uncharacterized protein n=1 Tax=Lacrimispora amygdalina TaxID=253257 RepID=A0ABQ5M674_9FIRM
MGRAHVEHAKRGKYEPHAMEVRGVCYKKYHLISISYVFYCSSINNNYLPSLQINIFL